VCSSGGAGCVCVQEGVSATTENREPFRPPHLSRECTCEPSTLSTRFDTVEPRICLAGVLSRVDAGLG
jgi:hypothetical protein